jgi:hypothetical protein
LAKSCSKDIVAIEADDDNNVAAEPAVVGANLSSISVCQLVIVMHAMKYYDAIGRSHTDANMHYGNILIQVLFQPYNHHFLLLLLVMKYLPLLQLNLPLLVLLHHNFQQFLQKSH